MARTQTRATPRYVRFEHGAGLIRTSLILNDPQFLGFAPMAGKAPSVEEFVCCVRWTAGPRTQALHALIFAVCL